jgi:hypothetical protein
MAALRKKNSKGREEPSEGWGTAFIFSQIRHSLCGLHLKCGEPLNGSHSSLSETGGSVLLFFVLPTSMSDTLT